MSDWPPFRAAVEAAVTRHLARPWAASQCRDMTEFACHPAAIFSDGAYGVFAKYSAAANGREQFEVELAGLRLLAERAGVLTPTPIGIVQVQVPAPSVASGTVLVLEAVPAVERGPQQWREIGQALARIHRREGERFGLPTDGYFGPLSQDNTPLDDWPAFYARRRLEPALRQAVDAGNLPADVARRVDRLIARLPALCGPAVRPTLLHGDAQQNNWISTARGPVVIDPAAYYGHPEMDLAFLDIWQPVPEEVLAAYGEERPIDPGFGERRELWRLWGYLAAVTVEGPAYLPRLVAAVGRYL